MIKYIISKKANKFVVEERGSKGMKIICETVLPYIVEITIAKEATRMNKIGIKYQVENRTNIFMDV